MLLKARQDGQLLQQLPGLAVQRMGWRQVRFAGLK
jgi:hypothetical protein